MAEELSAQRSGGCYVFFRIFPGLREPCDLARYASLSDAEVIAAMEADAARWYSENKAQVIEKLRKQSAKRMGGGPARSVAAPGREPIGGTPLTFPQIARIAGWTYRECFSIGVGNGHWASVRFPILATASEQEAVAVCEGLNYRHRDNPHPDSPRFGWHTANSFQADEQLQFKVQILEAQSKKVRGEPAEVIHSLAEEAATFYLAVRSPVDAKPAAVIEQPRTSAADPQGGRVSAGGKKKSTVKGEARMKIKAGLTVHHKFRNGGCLNWEPIKVNEFAKSIEVAPASVSVFLKELFGDDGYLTYCAVCRNDHGRLIEVLKLLNEDYSTLATYGRRPPGEGGGGDEE